MATGVGRENFGLICVVEINWIYVAIISWQVDRNFPLCGLTVDDRRETVAKSLYIVRSRHVRGSVPHSRGPTARPLAVVVSTYFLHVPVWGLEQCM